MKKNVILIALLIIVGAIFGSFFTYSIVSKQRPAPAPVQPTQQIETPETKATETPEAKPNAANIPGGTAVINAVKKLSPSVVFITTKSVFATRPNVQMPPGIPPEFRRFFSEPYEETPRERQGSGSGVIISSDGLILTNQHVIEGASDITVRIQDKNKPTDDSKDHEFKAKVIGADKLSDVAIIKIEAKNLPAATLGNSSSLLVGEWVIAVGNPYGFEHTATVGIISAVGRNLSLAGREYPNLLQTDAAINPGNSGGPLANLNGEVIGINTAIHSGGQGIGFAIPINWVKEIKDSLIKSGKIIRPYVGIQMVEMDDDKARYLDMPKTEGVLVYQVLKGSPADKAGLRRGDVILEIDSKKVNSGKELQKQIRSHKVGESVKMVIWREKKKINAEMKLTEMPADIVQ